MLHAPHRQDPRAALLDDWRALLDRSAKPPRHRDAAAALGVSEGALTEARRLTGAVRAIPRPQGPHGFGHVIARLGAVGGVMALTRNALCVHEKKGVYAAPSFRGAMAQTLGEIDLRLFLDQWACAYAVVETGEDGPRRSLQFYDRFGEAIHKVHATVETDAAAWDAMVDALAADAPPMVFEPAPPPAPERPDAEIDVAALRRDWAALEHSHAFYGLLAGHGVGRLQAMRLGGPDFAQRLAPDAARQALEAAADAAVPVMIFTGNRGCVQIHAGPVQRIVVMGPWLNVLDPRFNLHLMADRAASVWRVRKPSLRGDVHSVELFDDAGEAVCQIFGDRPPGAVERPDWRALALALPGAA
jgi:putative hemin transport protein